MAHLFKMPKLSDDMHEGTLVKWFKNVGDFVNEGDILVEIETDKANMEVECFYTGTILSFDVNEGDTVPIGTVIARIAETDSEVAESKEAMLSEPLQEIKTKPQTQIHDDPGDDKQPPIIDTNISTQRPVLEVVEQFTKTPVATPVARRMADDYGISLVEIQGTGPQGRIVKRDIEIHIKEGKPKTAVQIPGEILPLDQKRKYIIRKMVESKTTIPHYYLGVSVQMDDALKLRKDLNETHDTQITITDLIIKASANALKTYPLANAHYEEEGIKFNDNINIAVAVDTGEILLAPVIKNCESMTLTELSLKSAVLIEKARTKRLKPEDYEGGTFYISNVGGFGIEDIAPIIFPSTSAIIGVGAIKKTPVVDDNDGIVIRRLMRIIISADHRTLDGARGAEVLMEISKNLESPLNLLS